MCLCDSRRCFLNILNTEKVFDKWKKEFFQIKELDYFNVYLVGSFNDYINGKFSHINSHKKYTIDEIHKMTNEKLVTLDKFFQLNFVDIDVVITDNNDIDKIKKVFETTKKINKKYQVLDSTKNYIFFDLMYYSINSFKLKYSNLDEIECEAIKYENIDSSNIKKEKIRLPYEKHKKLFEMGYKPIKPTLLKNKLL